MDRSKFYGLQKPVNLTAAGLKEFSRRRRSVGRWALVRGTSMSDFGLASLRSPRHSHTPDPAGDLAPLIQIDL